MATVAELLVKIGADPSNFEKAIKRTEKSLNRMGKKLTDMGDKMTKGLTLPLAAAGLAAGNFASNTEAATGKIQAQLGTTAEEAEKLGSIAEGVWKNAFGASLDEVATSLTTLKRNMKGVADTDLQGLTESAYVLQDAFGADITQATKTAGTMMQNFGIDGQKAFDLITIGFTKGGDKSGELLDSMNEYGGQFASMGLSAEDMLNILITGADDGAFSIDKVGDAVKEFNIRAKDGSDATAEGFAAIGLKAGEMGLAIAEGGIKGKEAFDATIAGLAAMTDPLAQQQAGVALFGTQWEDIGKTVILAMDTTTNKLGEVDGATKRTGDALNDNFKTRATEAFRNAQSALEPLGNVLLSLADEWLPKISTAIESVVNWFTNLSPGIQKVIVIVGMVVAAIGPLLIAFGFIISAVGAMIPVLAFLVSPIGLIIAAVVLLAILIIANWDKIKAFTIKIWSAVSDFFGEIWSGIKSGVKNAAEWVVDKFDALMSFFSNLPGKVDQAAKGMWDGIKDSFRGMLNKIIGWWNDFDVSLTVPTNALTKFMGLAGKGFTLRTPNIPMLAEGTNNVPQDMFAMLHEGEAVVPKKYNNNQGNAGGGTLNHTGTIRVEGVNDRGQLVGVTEIVAREILTNQDRFAQTPSSRRVFR